MNAATDETLVTDAMQQSKGVWSDSRSSPPIAASDIRRWVIATCWPETPPRIHWDEDYASTTRWGGIIAPSDFNPFAWPVERPPRQAAALSPSGRKLTGMNGGQTDTYGVPMRPADVITTRTRLVEWHERQGRLGLTLYTTSETEWTNQAGEFVRRRMSIGVRY